MSTLPASRAARSLANGMETNFTLTPIASAIALAMSASSPMILPFLVVAIIGGCAPLMPTTNSPFLMIRSMAGPAEADMADIRNTTDSNTAKTNAFFIELLLF